MINFLDETKKSEKEEPKKEEKEKNEMTEPILEVPIHTKKRVGPEIIGPALPKQSSEIEQPVKEKPEKKIIKERNKSNFFKKTKQEFTKVFQAKTGPKEKINKTKIDKSIKKENLKSSNLIHENIIIIPRFIQEKFLILFAGIVVIAGIFFITLLYINWHFEKIKLQAQDYTQQIHTVEIQVQPLLALSNKITKLEEKASGVNEILSNHIYWTKFFGLLEKYTMRNIYFGNFAADTSGEIHLSGTAKNLIILAHQIALFQNAPDFIKGVKLSNVGINPTGISFSVDLKLVKGVFTK